MPDLTPQLRALLQAIIPCAQGQYPAQEAAFPCAVIYESGNAVQARCDGRAHLHALEYTVEIWAFSLGEAHALSVRADEALASLGLSRSETDERECSTLRMLEMTANQSLLLKEKPFGGRSIQLLRAVTHDLYVQQMPLRHSPTNAPAARRCNRRGRAQHGHRGKRQKRTDGACSRPGGSSFSLPQGDDQRYTQFNPIGFHVTHRFFGTFLTQESTVPPRPLTPALY